MKKYIAPACETMRLATEETLLVTSFKIDPNTEVSTQLSNRIDDFDDEWDD